MNPYIEQLKAHLAGYESKHVAANKCSILEQLWFTYSASNPVDDGYIKQSEDALSPIFQELSMQNSDTLFDLIATLCIAYQRAAFLEGIQIGARLFIELGEER